MVDADLNPQVVAQVRDATDIVEVVGDHVRLKRRGRRWQGLCPFHEEKTPSFSVDPEKGLFYCFGCRAGGDAIHFLMQVERLDFPAAVERLARRFGVQLPPRSPQARRQREQGEKLRTLLEEAQHWLVQQLAEPAAEGARAELVRRGFEAASWANFGFGFAPDDWRQMLTAMSRRHPEGSLVAAGLAVQPESGGNPYDRFRNRLTFPIRAADGRLIAFGGRVLGDGEPKYLNSPESPLFAKRQTLFCLDRARRAIASRGEVLVVEGYFDCLSLHRVGLDHAVATLGTALTPEHARILRRLLGPDGRVMLCYDADEAGRRAAAAGAQVLLTAGVDVVVVVVEGGKDPDDVIRDGGVDAMRALLADAVPILRFLLADLPGKPAERRTEGLKLAPLVCAAGDPAVRRNLIEELARELYLRPVEIEEAGRQRRVAASPATVGRQLPSAGEHNLAQILVECSGEWRQKIVERVELDIIRDPRVRELVATASRLVTEGRAHEDLVAAQLASEGSEATREYLAELTNSEMPEIDERIIRRQLVVFLDRQAKERSRGLGPLIEAAEQRGDLQEVNRLLAEKARLRLNPPEI